MSEQHVARLIAELDRARRRVYSLLRSTDARLLSKRTPSGNWSVIENVRHLIFAEQVHLGQFLPDGSAWNPMRLTRHGKVFRVKGGVIVIRRDGRQFAAQYAGGAPRTELERVLRAWDVIHQPLRKAVKATGADPQCALERHLGHLLRHVEVIEKQLARASKDS